MKISKLVFLLSAVYPILLISAEPSAFGAGNLDSPNPYGLTSNEKVILDTKKKLNKVSVKSNNQANELDSLRERIDGLQSIIESLSRKAHNNKINIQKQNEKNLANRESVDLYEKRLSEVVQSNTTSIEQQKIVITEMSLLLDTINTHYVSKDEFNTLVTNVNEFKELIVKELKSNTKSSSKSKLDSMSSSDVYKEAQAYYKKRYYTNAIENYEHLIKKNYKPAFSHYMIGEMNYKRKNYANAISYFKKSSSLYSKASYMPKLMLHTAISMRKTGDKDNAKNFFKAIVAKYPNSIEAKEANEYLQP
ncbi:tetratricopeptide repeat protein [Sulfurimonas aquatica]|uniref:Tetratricopeptide repeat protein n=1 Tax=Sulfurimonas aquatica TaxID=2672570 RepID=A0A975B167_9BACT|nr:tetratricopeptide repeat protein [Sulfurimonas aquatica]QSZ42250.1 tetratricopeptide repeat protein [Sulfurimonas aquatica]